MTIQFSDGRSVHVEDTGLSLEIEVKEQFTAPVGRCLLLDDQGTVITDTVLSREITVVAGTYVLGRRRR